MKIKNEFTISEAEMIKLNQLINNKSALRSPVTKNEAIAGIHVKPIKGKLIKIQNLFLERTAFVWSQK